MERSMKSRPNVLGNLKIRVNLMTLNRLPRVESYTFCEMTVVISNSGKVTCVVDS